MLAVFSLAACPLVLGQEGSGALPEMSPEEAAAFAEYMTIASPGEHHKHLEPFVGTWETTTKMWMGGPGSQPSESKGVSRMRWILGGRYILDEFEGETMGQPYEGLGLTGYDNYKNLYVSMWASNIGTELLTMSGSRHPETGIFTYYGTMDEPMLDVSGRMVKYVTRFVDEDHFVFETYDLHAGDDYKVFEITYTRQEK